MVEGHRTRLGEINRSTCVSMGCPPPPYIKEWRRGGAGSLLWRALGSPTPTGSRIPPFHVVGVGEKEREKRREARRGRSPSP